MEKDYGQIFLSHLKEVRTSDGRRLEKKVAEQILKFFLILIRDIEFGKTEEAKKPSKKEVLDIEGCSEEIIKMFKDHPDLEPSVYKEYIKYIFLKIEESKKASTEEVVEEKPVTTKGTKSSKGKK